MKRASLRSGLFLFMFAILISSPLAFADVFDWFGQITGKATSGSSTVSVTLGNTAPTVTNVSYHNTTGGSQISPSEGTTRTMFVLFNATDTDGIANINDTSANVTVSRNGVFHTNTTTCAIEMDVNPVQYNCSIFMDYYDEPGSWTINASVRDINGAIGILATLTFTYDTLHAVTFDESSITFGSVSPAATNTLATNNPLTITNTGNANGLLLNVTAQELFGVSTPSEKILASDFTGNDANACDGDALTNATSRNITGVSVARGSGASDDAYFCLEQITGGLSAQAYSTAAGFANWTLTTILPA